jgi:RNA polymerase sigma-70 factor (ECF subfamily)
MDDRLDLLLPGLVTRDDDLETEFEALLGETSTLAFRVAFGVLRHQQDAEDVAQESFAKAFRHFRRLRDRTRFRAWLVRMAWRTALDRQRSNRRRGARELVVDGSALTEAARADGLADQAARDRAAALWTAIDALPEKLRLVVVLSGIQGHDHREVATLLRIPEGTVKSRMFLARQQLKETLR